MAVSKSASRKSAAKKAAKTRKSRTAAKKAAVTRKKRVAAKKAVKKAVVTRKKRAAAKKAVVTRRKKAAVVPAMTGGNTAEIDARIAIARNNLRDLVEQAASYSGAADEERMSQRIADQEAKIEALKKQRGGL